MQSKKMRKNVKRSSKRKTRWCIRVLVITSPFTENLETAMCAGSEEDIIFDKILATESEINKMVTSAYYTEKGIFKLLFPPTYETAFFITPLIKLGHVSVYRESNGKNPVRQAEELLRNK